MAKPEIPGCKIISVLGEGGMSTVYLGVQEKLERKVAIKVLEPAFLKNKLTAARFEREAKTAAMLSHSNIIQIFDTDKAGDYFYIVMEYLEKSLKDQMKINPGGRMPPGKALDIIENIMKALDYAHFRGVFHRDIKPDNIMFRQDDTPVLVDFGIARVFESKDELTKSGVSMGTSYYMSPEQCRALLDIDGRSDIYSLGVILYEMLAGQKPYEGKTQVSIVLKHIQDPVPQLPDELSQYQPLIDRMMAKDRDERLSTAPQFLEVRKKISAAHQETRTQPEDLSPTPVEKPYPTQPIQYYPSSQGETAAVTTPEKPIKDKEVPIVNRYFNILDKKLRAFKLKPFMGKLKNKCGELIEATKENFGPFGKKIQDKVRSLKKTPSQKKWALRIVFVILFILIFISVFRPGFKKNTQKTKAETQINQIYTRPFLTELFKQASGYVKFLHDLYNKKDFNNIEKALALVRGLKEKKTTPGLNDLEKKLTDRKIQLEKEFEESFAAAKDCFEKKDYAKARDHILRAREIKEPPMLISLESDIEREYEKVKNMAKKQIKKKGTNRKP
jgi:serine/threonine protein kinase